MLGLVTITLLLATTCFASYPTLKDGDTISISLAGFNVSDPDGQSVESFYTISPNSSVTIKLVDVPGDAVYFVQQAHTFFHNICLSSTPLPAYNTSVSGTNIGLWSGDVVPKFYLNYVGNNADATIMLATQAYSHQAPIPGGCNMEFPTEIAPYLQTTYNNSTVSVIFSPGSPPYSVLVWLGLIHQHSCMLPPPSHTVYRAYLRERDFSPDMYFSALKNMMTVGRIRVTGHVVARPVGSTPVVRLFAAYPGTGSAYVAVVRTQTHAAVYVPSFSYACDASVEDDTCAVLTTAFSKVVCAAMLFLGLFACFAAHRFFLIETLMLGFLAGGVIIYTSLYKFATAPDGVLLVAVLGGLLVGLSLVICWSCFAYPLISITLATSVLGFLISSILVMPFVDYADLTSDFNFWVTFVCILLLAPTLCTSLMERANVLSTSLVGAYAAVVPIDYYIGTNLRFILLNVLRRATVPGFQWAVIDPPFQINDIFLTILWLLLAIGGYTSQSFLIRNKPPFPAPTHSIGRLYRRLRGPSTPPPLPMPNERTHLLAYT